MKVRSDALAEWLQGVHSGPPVDLEGVAGLERATPTDLSFVDPKVEPTSQAGCLLIQEPLRGRTCVVVDDPREAFCRVIAHHFPEPGPTGIHPTALIEGEVGQAAIGPYAVVGAGAVIEDGAVLHAHVVVGEGCRVGRDTVLFPRVVLYPGTTVGRRCRIHAGAVIGADGFGYHTNEHGVMRLPHAGAVRIEDDVDIGANTCIDRAMADETVVGGGTKIDNLVQVGHNVRLGHHNFLSAQVGIAGSTETGAGVQIGGQAGLVDHITVGDGARIGAGSGVAKSVPPGQTVLGSPAMPIALTLRIWASLRRLPDLIHKG